MNFTDEQQAAFQKDGYIVVSGLFNPEQVAAALEEIELRTYGKSFNEYLADHDKGSIQKVENYALGADEGASASNRSQFPTGSKILDGLLENEHYLDCFAACLGSDQMSYCNGHLFVRSGPDDAGHEPEPWKGFHIDNNTNSFLPPHPDIARYAYINSWVLLHDIEADGAPLQVIPSSHRQIAEVLPRLTKSGDGIRGFFGDIRAVPEFSAPIPVTGKAGDTLLYSSYLVHGAVGFADKRKQRAVWTMSIGRAQNNDWTKFSHLYQWAERAYAIPFWTETTPRIRSIFGWPSPGDPYYTPQTLELLADWFPGIDLRPYVVG